MSALTLPDLLAAIAVAESVNERQRIVRLAYLFGDLAGYGDRENDTYMCSDESGRKHRVDLLVDGGLSGSPADDDRKWLIGRAVECDHLTPWIEIAMTVRLMEPTL